MIKQPAYLKKGDKIAIVCPASKLPKSIEKAMAVFKSWGLEVVTGQTVTAGYHQFAGDDALRIQDLQHYLDDPSVRAVIAGRGGYGTLRIIDELDFRAFAANPKWIVGFSDVTVLLSHVYARFGIRSIHGQMPYTFDEATPESLESLRYALFGEEIKYHYPPAGKTKVSQVNPVSSSVLVPNRLGQASGILIGGNLTLLVMVSGSISEIDYTDKILFIEDIGERPSSIDRMMRMLKRSGKLAKLRGLIVGAFNELPEEKIPFGQSPEEVIWDVVKEYDYPVCFNFPVGHVEDNRAMVLGRSVNLIITNRKIELSLSE